MIVRIQDHRSTVVVPVGGVVDFTTAPPLQAVLADLVDAGVDGGRSIVLDLVEVSLLDGHSIGMLIATVRRASEHGNTFRYKVLPVGYYG